jgi:fumarate reductase iron-sulfur subunit
MKIEVYRYCPAAPNGAQLVAYEIEERGQTLLEALTTIKTTIDATLSFASGCRSSVCGSCAMRVNGVEVLACSYKVKEGDVVEPLKNMEVIRDLVVDKERALNFNVLAHAYGSVSDETKEVTPLQEKVNELQSECILCGSCYSACPVYAVNGDFLGPFALTRNWRYVSDVREEEVADKIATVQSNGIWDCTLCNECVPVCPVGIAPKQDIVMLRNKSGVMGYMDPSFASGFGGSFGNDGTPSFGGPAF